MMIVWGALGAVVVLLIAIGWLCSQLWNVTEERDRIQNEFQVHYESNLDNSNLLTKTLQSHAELSRRVEQLETRNAELIRHYAKYNDKLASLIQTSNAINRYGAQFERLLGDLEPVKTRGLARNPNNET